MAERAAEYVRMSTEHQRYSTENQSDVIRQYAARRNIEIVRTYADEGKSGLRLEGRDALKRLIADVESGQADFTTILVYDVSRWGRFQDPDEGGHYEFICKNAGIKVQYLRRAVRQRRQPGLDHRQGRQARHGRGVQPRAVGQGVRRPVPPDRARLSPGRTRPASDLRRCLIDQSSNVKGRTRPRRAQEHPDRPRHSGAGSRRGGRHRPLDLSRLCRGSQNRARNRREPQSARHPQPISGAHGHAAPSIRF